MVESIDTGECRPRRDPERGAGSVLVVSILVVVGVIGGALVELGAALRERVRAQGIADVVALAAVHSESDATEVAAANGVKVVALERRGERVIVTVRLDATTAVAAAEWRRD